MRCLLFWLGLLIQPTCAQQLYVPSFGPTSVLDGFDGGSFPFQNFIKGSSFANAQATLLSQGNLSADGYPVATPANNTIYGQIFLPPSQTLTKRFVWNWRGCGSWQLTGVYAHVISIGGTGITIPGGGTPPFNISNNFTVEGCAPDIVMDFGPQITGAVNSATTPGICTLTIVSNPFVNGQIVNVSGVGGATGCNGHSLTVVNKTNSTIDLIGSTWTGASYTSGGQAFLVSGTYNDGTANNGIPQVELQALAIGTWSRNSGMVFCRESDYSTDQCADTATGAPFLPEFITAVTTLHPKVIRPLDSGAAVDGAVGFDWPNRQRVTTIAYGTVWLPNYWTRTTCSGTATICGTDTYTAAAAPSTPASMTDGEVFQGQFLNANLTTVPTLNVGGRGAYPIYGSTGTLESIVLGGSPSTGDVLHITFAETDGQSTCIPGGAYTFSYTVLSSDTTLSTLAHSMFEQSLSDATLNGANIFFSLNNGINSIYYNLNCGGGITFGSSLSGGATETITLGYQAASSFTAGSNWSFTFSAILKGWIAANQGIDMRVPLETQVALANAVGSGLWYPFPFFSGGGQALNGFAASNDDVTAATSYIKSHLNASPGFWAEYSNEIWNFANPQTPLCVSIGAALGMTQGVGGNDSIRQAYDCYAWKYRTLIGNNVTSAYGTSGLHRVLAGWAIDSSANMVSQRLNGSDLTTTGNTTYGAIIGTNYNSAPNRPIDFADGLSYATYYQGAVMNGGAPGGSTSFNGSTSNSITCVPLALGSGKSDIGCMTAAADAYANGDVLDAFYWMANDTVAGTANGSLGQSTTNYFYNTIYPAWNTIANSYAPHRPIWNYEGGYQGQRAPATSSCNAVRIATAYCGSGGKIANMIAGWKLSGSYYTVAFNQYVQFLLGSPPGSSPAKFSFGGNAGTWAFYATDIFGTPYADYSAIEQFNSNHL